MSAFEREGGHGITLVCRVGFKLKKPFHSMAAIWL